MRSSLQIVALTIVISIGSAVASPIFIDEGAYPVSPKGTFLFQSSNDNCSSSAAAAGCSSNDFLPTFINLSALDISAGEVINVVALGQFCFYGGAGCTEYQPYIGGVFSSQGPSSLLPNNELNRLPGAISSGLPNVTDPNLNTYFGDQVTTIPQDFQILDAPFGGTTVVVPQNANWLVVGVLDSFYADNTGSLSVQLSLESTGVPEPGSYATVLAGLAGLAALRLRRSTSSSRQPKE